MNKVALSILLLSIFVPGAASSGPLYKCVDKGGTVYLTDKWDKDYVRCTPLDYYRETPGDSGRSAETPPAPGPVTQAEPAPQEASPSAPQGVKSEAEAYREADEAAAAAAAATQQAPSEPEPPKKKPAYWPPVRGK